MKKLLAVVATLASLFVAGHAFAADIEIKDAWTKASLGQVRNGAGFLTVINHGGEDRIVNVRSDLAEKTELHTHIMANNVMKMRQVEGGIHVPMHGEVQFKPGSYHVMLMGLKKPLEEGEMINVTLEFEKAGDVPVMIKVMGPLAKGPAGMDAMHGNMSHGDEDHGDEGHGKMDHSAH